MKIAIHSSKNSFSQKWIAYCQQNNIPFALVNCYDSNIVDQLKEVDGLMWHHNHANPSDVLFAKQLLVSLEEGGKTVFPNYHTAWHFDDKVGQKYLLESIGAPMVPSYVYYSRKEACKAIDLMNFPIVFKLRRGAGSRNVKLLKTKKQAKNAIKKSFSSGFHQYDALGGIKEQIRKYRENLSNLKEIFKAAAHIVLPIRLERSAGREAGYFYFQKFIPNNEFDIRVIVIGDKAIAIKRMVRDGDFRASGSGTIIYDPKEINTECIRISFEVFNKIKKLQCLAFDFVFDKLNNPLIVELSYGFTHKAYEKCPGYWNSDLEWKDGLVSPADWMVEEVLKDIQLKK